MIDYIEMNMQAYYWPQSLKQEVREKSKKFNFFYDKLNSKLFSNEFNSINDIEKFVKEYAE